MKHRLISGMIIVLVLGSALVFVYCAKKERATGPAEIPAEERPAPQPQQADPAAEFQNFFEDFAKAVASRDWDKVLSSLSPNYVAEQLKLNLGGDRQKFIEELLCGSVIDESSLEPTEEMRCVKPGEVTDARVFSTPAFPLGEDIANVSFLIGFGAPRTAVRVELGVMKNLDPGGPRYFLIGSVG